MEQKLQYIVDKIGELNIQITEKQAEQFFRYMLSGSYEVSSSLNWIKNDEWFVSRLFILQMETAGIETIRAANIKKKGT